MSTAGTLVPFCSHLSLVAAYRGLHESVGPLALPSWPCRQSLTAAPVLRGGARTLRWARRRANQLWRISLALPPRVARSRGAPPARHRGGDAPHSWCPRLVVIFAKGPRCRSRVSFERPWRDAAKGPAREGPSPTTAQCSAACVSDSVCNGSLASDATYTWWPRTDSYHTSSAKSGICPFRIYDVSQ